LFRNVLVGVPSGCSGRSLRPERRNHAGGEPRFEPQGIADHDDERTAPQSPRIAEPGVPAGTSLRRSARSGSSPGTSAFRKDEALALSLTTWLLVKTSPSPVMMTPVLGLSHRPPTCPSVPTQRATASARNRSGWTVSPPDRIANPRGQHRRPRRQYIPQRTQGSERPRVCRRAHGSCLRSCFRLLPTAR
jgi:hypothetical protein